MLRRENTAFRVRMGLIAMRAPSPGSRRSCFWLKICDSWCSMVLGKREGANWEIGVPGAAQRCRLEDGDRKNTAFRVKLGLAAMCRPSGA